MSDYDDRPDRSAQLLYAQSVKELRDAIDQYVSTGSEGDLEALEFAACVFLGCTGGGEWGVALAQSVSDKKLETETGAEVP